MSSRTYPKNRDYDNSRLFHEPPYHRHFSDKTALNIRDKEFESKELGKRYYFGDDHDEVCGHHKHAREPSTTTEPKKPQPPSHDRRLLELEIHRLERQYAEARQRYEKIKYKEK